MNVKVPYRTNSCAGIQVVHGSWEALMHSCAPILELDDNCELA